MTTYRTIVLLAVLSGFSALSHGASVELWPANRRLNNTFYCYGDDWNALNFILAAEDYRGANGNGRYKFDDAKVDSGPAVLKVTIPSAVEFLGAYRTQDTATSRDYERQVNSRDGTEYTEISIPLGDALRERIKGRSFYLVFVWIKPPEHLDETMYWTLEIEGEVIASSSVRLRTAGVVKEGQTLPKRFGFWPYGPSYGAIPNGDFDELAGLYRRLGVTGFESHWTSGLPRDDDRVHPMLMANRRAGITNIANMTLFCRTYGKGKATANPGAAKGTGGLVEIMDIACAGIESAQAIEAWSKAAGNFDLALFDWEPKGPREWPGYDEPASIAAFAREEGITGPITPERIKTEFRDEYARFRMEQTARPIASLKKTIDAVKPMPLQAEQGDGMHRHIDYDVYGHGVRQLRPMIYKNTPQAYAWDLVQMLKSTLVPSKKFIPDLTVGWPLAGSYRQTPEEFLLDVIVTAAAGCGGVAHWPGPHRSDATWYGIYEALLRIALVEDFYFDGKASEKISITGIPHNVRKIDTGGSVIELHGPDWRPVLMSFAHQLNDEYLLTVINYHELRDAFVEISSSVLRNHHLVDPVNKLYYACDDQGRAIVRVNAKTPVLLVATTDARRIEKCRPIDPQTIETQLDIDRREYLKAHALADIDLGRAGDIDVAFAEIEFGGEPKVALRVRTPRQIVYFGNGGGRIYDWVVKGMPAFVAKGDFSTDGVGMDLLWLPAEARFSGDESTDMTLVSCDNDGSACRIVYEGEFKNALPGLLIRKEYKIQAQDTTVHVTLKLHNARSAEMEFSYWQHNVLTLTTVQFIAGPDAPECKIQGTAIFPVQGLSDDVHKHIFSPRKIVGTTSGTYAEFYPEIRAGLVFSLPAELMNVYRWTSPKQGLGGSEWMTVPMTLLAGENKTMQYSISVAPNTTPELLRESLK